MGFWVHQSYCAAIDVSACAFMSQCPRKVLRYHYDLSIMGITSTPAVPLFIPLRRLHIKSVLRLQYQELAMHWKLQLRLPACLPACLDLRRLARDSWIELMGWKLQACICALGSNFNLHYGDPRGLASACGGGWCNPLPAHGY